MERSASEILRLPSQNIYRNNWNFECKQIKTKNWKEKAGLSCKYSTLSLLNQSDRSGVDGVCWPFPHRQKCTLQSFLLHTNRIKYKLLRNHKDNIWSCMQLLEPEKWRKAKIEVDLPNLSICGRCLCNDRTGLWRWHGLLNHNAGVVVWHPCIGQLVRSRSCHCSSNCVMHGDIL